MSLPNIVEVSTPTSPGSTSGLRCGGSPMRAEAVAGTVVPMPPHPNAELMRQALFGLLYVLSVIALLVGTMDLLPAA